MNEPCRCCINYLDGKCMITNKSANMKGCSSWEFDYLFIAQEVEKEVKRRVKILAEIITPPTPKPGRIVSPVSWFADAVSRSFARRVKKVRYGKCYMYMQWDRERINEYWEFPTKEDMEIFKKEYDEISPDCLRDIPNNFIVAEGEIWKKLPGYAKESKGE